MNMGEYWQMKRERLDVFADGHNLTAAQINALSALAGAYETRDADVIAVPPDVHTGTVRALARRGIVANVEPSGQLIRGKMIMQCELSPATVAALRVQRGLFAPAAGGYFDPDAEKWTDEPPGVGG